MIDQDKIVINRLSKLFNSKMSSYDFAIITINLSDSQYYLKYETMELKVFDRDVYFQLRSINYTSLLQHLIQNLKIEDEFRDVIYSEVDNEMIELFQYLLINEGQITEFRINDEKQQFEIVSRNILLDLIWQPLGEFHNEVASTFNDFNNFKNTIEKHGGSIKDSFLKANSSNPISNFIQCYVAEFLGLSLSNSNILVI